MRIVATQLSVPASLALKAHMRWLCEDFEPRWLGRELRHSDRLQILADMLEMFAGPDAPVRPPPRLAMRWLCQEFEPRWLQRQLSHPDRLGMLWNMQGHFTGPDAPGRRYASMEKEPSGTVVVAKVPEP